MKPFSASTVSRKNSCTPMCLFLGHRNGLHCQELLTMWYRLIEVGFFPAFSSVPSKQVCVLQQDIVEYQHHWFQLPPQQKNCILFRWAMLSLDCSERKKVSPLPCIFPTQMFHSLLCFINKSNVFLAVGLQRRKQMLLLENVPWYWQLNYQRHKVRVSLHFPLL